MSLLNTVNRTDKSKTRYFSKKQEDTVAKNLNGNRTLNSGATKFQKGDVLIDGLFLVECKTKTSPSNSILIKKEWFEKNLQESLLMGKPYTTIAFNFGPGEQNYYIIDEQLMQYLVEKLKEE